MLGKCCTQYARKFGKFSSGHRTGKGQVLFQSLPGSSPSRIQGNPQDERHRRMREREKERKRERKTRPECAAESGSCFIFHHRLYTLSWYISKGEISTQTSFNITSACPSGNQVFSVYFLFMRVFSHRFFVHYLLALSLAENRSGSLMVEQVAT